MKTSEKFGWIAVILASTIVFSLIVSNNVHWYRDKVLVQEAIYEYVPTSQTQIIACWVFAIAVSIVIGAVAGLLIYGAMEEKKGE